MILKTWLEQIGFEKYASYPEILTKMCQNLTYKTNLSNFDTFWQISRVPMHIFITDFWVETISSSLSLWVKWTLSTENFFLVVVRPPYIDFLWDFGAGEITDEFPQKKGYSVKISTILIYFVKISILYTVVVSIIDVFYIQYFHVCIFSDGCMYYHFSTNL